MKPVRPAVRYALNPVVRVRSEARNAHRPPPKRHPYNQWSPDARALDLVGDKWTLLIVRDLAGGPRRFVELQRVLPGISTEQLRSRLNRMVADGLLTRQRYREVPPRVDYELTERARELLPVVGALARWGYDWAWSAPRPGEAIDIGAIFRLAPGLLDAAGRRRGTVELTVESARRRPPSATTADRRRRARRDPRSASDAGRRRARSPAPSTPGSRRSAPTASRVDLEFRATAASPTRCSTRFSAAAAARRVARASGPTRRGGYRFVR